MSNEKENVSKNITKEEVVENTQMINVEGEPKKDGLWNKIKNVDKKKLGKRVLEGTIILTIGVLTGKLIEKSKNKNTTNNVIEAEKYEDSYIDDNYADVIPEDNYEN